jgi:hypothetical protein
MKAVPPKVLRNLARAFQPEGQPARRPHEYLGGETAKLLTLLRPATGEVRAEALEHSTNAVLHPWLKRELEDMLKQCPPVPEVVPQGRRWQDWDISPEAWQLDRFFPPVRVLLILDNLAGHKSYRLVQWCAEHGILLLWTPTAGSWLNMAESLQRILQRRALSGQHQASVQTLKRWLTEAVAGWNRPPTPFIWGGNTMPVATGPTLGGTAWQDQGRRRPTPFLGVSARFATTRGWPNATGLASGSSVNHVGFQVGF